MEPRLTPVRPSPLHEGRSGAIGSAALSAAVGGADSAAFASPRRIYEASRTKIRAFSQFFLALAVSRAIWRAAYIPKQLSSLLTFGVGMSLSEMPAHALLLQLFLLARGYWGRLDQAGDNAISRAGSTFSFTIALTTLFPLMKMISHQWNARYTFLDALKKAGIPTELAARGPNVRQTLACAVPIPHILSSDIQCNPAIVYSRVQRKVKKRDRAAKGCEFEVFDLKLDLYWQAGARPHVGTGSHGSLLPHKMGAPVLCYVHGGGWITGHRNNHSLALIYEMARQGWLVATVNYRLAPRSPYPSMLLDCKRALVWLRQNIGRYGGNPDFIAVGGESAGGHLSLMLGLTANIPQFQPVTDASTGVGIDLKPGQQLPASARRSTVDTSVQGVVDLYGVTDWTDAGSQYMGRDNGTGGIRSFVGNLVLRKRYASHVEEYIEGSPIWWLFGSQLPTVLERLGVHLVEEPPTAEVVRFPDEQQAAASPEQVHASTADAHEKVVEIDTVDFRTFDTTCSRTSIGHMFYDRRIPPCLVIHGDSDTLVPLKDSTRFFRILQQRRIYEQNLLRKLDRPESVHLRPLIPDALVVAPGAHHACNFLLSPRTFALGDAVGDWLQLLYRTWCKHNASSLPAKM